MHTADITVSKGGHPRNQSQYVDMNDSKKLAKDPVLRDAFSLLPQDMRDYIKSQFGDEFYVRRDMLKDAFGYRKASVGDAWTGNSRWSPATQKVVRDMALSVWGNKAYRILLARESEVQGLVIGARQLIVVKSVIVPVANFMSGIYQLISRGVPVLDIARALPKKLAEISAYTRSRVREVAAEAELRAAEGRNDVREVRALTTEIQTIKDSYRRMSIWPLIERGEFTAISDAGISREDLLLTEGKLHEFMERHTKKLPESVQNAGRYAFVTKDTALFQGLQKAVQYSDFIAKAILYDDLTIRQKKTKEYALGRITEEFVNYDRLPGRTRGYLEDIGLLWFYNFKIRSVKIALSMVRNNPVHVLLAGLMPAPPGIGSIGTPLGDNLFSKTVDGSITASMGPWMGFGAPGMNPVVNVFH